MTQLDIHLNELKSFCIKNLKRLFNSKHMLFHYRECLQSQKIESSLSYRYSIMALLGLYAHKNHPEVKAAFDLKQLHTALVEKCKQCNSLEDLGLLLWLDARNDAKFVRQILNQMEKLVPEKNFVKLATYELAWLLTGLAYAMQKSPRLQTTKWLELTHCVFENLQARFCQSSGMFYHCAPLNIKSRIRQNTSDFADQIYSIYASATYYQFSSQKNALEMAQQCATRLAALQGPAGEWWWLYNTNGGRVAYRYPVYTVHQDGMAPMAYMKLAEITRENWDSVINNSFSWLFESNCFIKIDFETLKIIRGVRIMPPFLKHLAVLFSMLRLTKIPEKIFYKYFKRYDVINEYRAYHLGWILYFIGYRENLNRIYT